MTRPALCWWCLFFLHQVLQHIESVSAESILFLWPIFLVFTLIKYSDCYLVILSVPKTFSGILPIHTPNEFYYLLVKHCDASHCVFNLYSIIILTLFRFHSQDQNVALDSVMFSITLPTIKFSLKKYHLFQVKLIPNNLLGGGSFLWISQLSSLLLPSLSPTFILMLTKILAFWPKSQADKIIYSPPPAPAQHVLFLGSSRQQCVSCSEMSTGLTPFSFPSL